MTKTPPAIAAHGLTMRFQGPEGEITLFEELELTIGQGESTAILGASGSGKSTLLGLLAGLDRPTAGSVWLAGADLTALDEDGRARSRAGRVGFVFQSFHLLSGQTAVENVALPGELAGNPAALQDARRALEGVGLEHRLYHYPAQLSGGEQQRVALARAFVTAPEVLFADEPTGNLDRHTGAQIIDALFAMNRERGTTLVLVTHDPDLADRCHRVLRLAGGRLSEA